MIAAGRVDHALVTLGAEAVLLDEVLTDLLVGFHVALGRLAARDSAVAEAVDATTTVPIFLAVPTYCLQLEVADLLLAVLQAVPLSVATPGLVRERTGMSGGGQLELARTIRKVEVVAPAVLALGQPLLDE